jgi:tetratricopeptide (TPR) repeat protein
MSSIIPGFTYDIFISYRQKDNRGERWVSEFVEALKTEIDSTFKEEVSLYFDVNPHDGLLETHDVDASLKEKLKCVIFIPVISRTYCDPNSFAWQHEFIPFVETAQDDQYGLKISVPNGNVTSRVLPVRIHDLDSADIKLCESVLGSVLRGIDFVYKSPGVNRPLRPNEDRPQDNLNKTYYRDQINKVANGVKEIISSLRKYKDRDETNSDDAIKNVTVKPQKRKTKIIITSLISLAFISLLYLIIPKHQLSKEPVEKTIAVLPFDKWFKDKDYSYLGDAIASQINSQLRTVRTLHVISFNSTRRYIGSDIPATKQIGKECGANILLQGSLELLNNNKEVSINVQLINIDNNNVICDEKFKGELDSLQEIRSRIIIKIASELDIRLSSEENNLIKKGITRSSDAYQNFLSANYQNEAANLVLMGKKYQDSISFELAIQMYDKAIKYDSSFALAYARRSISRSTAYFKSNLPDQDIVEKCKKDIDKALKIDPKLAEAWNANGFYYYYCKNEYQQAIECFNHAALLDPGNWQSIFYMAVVYRRIGEWTKSQTLLTKVLKYNPQDALILTNIGTSYFYLRDYDSALIFHNRALKIMPNWDSPFNNKMDVLLLKNGSTNEARLCLDTAINKTGKRFQRERILLDIYDLKFKEALIKVELSDPKDFYNQGDKFLQFATIHDYLGNTELARIYYDSAFIFFIKQIKVGANNSINYIQLSRVYAGLKKPSKAIEAAKKAVLLSTDVLNKNDKLIELGKIYVKCGEFQNGIEQIDYLLKIPSSLSYKILFLDPEWKPILDKPEFHKIVEKFSSN